MQTSTMFINGEAASAQDAFDVVNPSTGAVVGTAPDCAAEHLERAMSAAATSFAAWSADDAERRARLVEVADVVEAAAGEIAPTLTAEQGKPLRQAAEEVRVAARWIRYYAGLELADEVIQDDAAAHVRVTRRPVGPVAAIAPWNAPIALAAWKIGPALRAGCTMVLKPSPFTPLSTLALGELIGRMLPPGVLNVVSGRDPLGARMTAHPVPRKITFTGSVETGKKVARDAASDLKRVTLELGGNDPAILLDDVDVASVAPRIFASAFANNGQICDAIKRVYVPRHLHDELADALAEQAHAARVGDGFDPETTLGPLQNAPQFERVKGLVACALADGAKAVAGGRAIDGPGYFFEPTILVGAADGATVVDEEQFGPVLPVIPYDDLDDAIVRANRTRFGLGSSVWSSDVTRAAGIAEQMESGTTWINAHLTLGPHQPFGGAKWSGLGVEGGHWGLESFTELHVMYTARGGA